MVNDKAVCMYGHQEGMCYDDIGKCVQSLMSIIDSIVDIVGSVYSITQKERKFLFDFL